MTEVLPSFLAGEGAYAFKTAYDEEFARYSPGRKSPAGFRELLPTTGPRYSAPPWWETEA